MEEWKIYRLGDLVDFQNGYAFKSSKFLYDGKYKIIRIKELKNGLVKFFEDTVSISDEPNEILSKILVNKGDVIFALTGDPVSKQNANSWVGRVSLYTHDIPAYLNQRTCKIIQCNNVVPQYVYYYFRQYENLYSLASKATGSASQANISTKILEDTEILLPSLSVQEKMVAILASLDNKIALNRRINDNLEQQAQALFKSWFVDFEPFKDGKFVDSEMGMIPEGWKVVQLGEIIEISKRIINPQKNPDKIFYHYSLPACDNGLIPEIQSGKDIMSNKIILQNNTILFSKLNPRIKRIWFACDVLNDSICSTEFIPYRAKNERESVYIYSIINSDSFYASVLGCVNGATGSHQRFHAEDTLGLLFPYKKDIVDKYIDLVKPVLAEIHKLRIENKTLALTRDSLLPRLMSGELKFNDLNN